jgi:hypothetical protein
MEAVCRKATVLRDAQTGKPSAFLRYPGWLERRPAAGVGKVLLADQAPRPPVGCSAALGSLLMSRMSWIPRITQELVVRVLPFVSFGDPGINCHSCNTIRTPASHLIWSPLYPTEIDGVRLCNARPKPDPREFGKVGRRWGYNSAIGHYRCHEPAIGSQKLRFFRALWIHRSPLR